MGWWSGSKSKVKQHSLLSDTQRPLQNQLEASAMKQGAGGVYGDVADYYRGNLSNDPTDFNAMAAPEMRRYNEQIIPDIAEQYAGMGSGALSSSGFQNAAVNAGADLSERLGAIRANLRQNSAQGLQQIGSQALNPTVENVMHQGQPGFGQTFASGLGSAIGSGITGGFGSLGKMNPFGGSNVGAKTSPYGNLASSSAQSAALMARR